MAYEGASDDHIYCSCFSLLPPGNRLSESWLPWLIFMERRISERKPVDVNVYVSLPGQSAICCTASDISEMGIFLKTNPLHVPRRIPLNLVFALQLKSSNVVRMHHISAVVTRSEVNGVGMMFCKESKTQSSQRENSNLA